MGARAASSIDWESVGRLRRALESRLRLTRLLVSGYRARGQARQESDYDFIVVSPDFQGVSPLWRGPGLNLLWNDLAPGVDAEFVCLTPDEFNGAIGRPTSWLTEAAAEAVEIR